MTTSVPKVRNTAINKVRTNSKKDPSPKWEGQESWSAEQFSSHFREAMRYYNLEHSGKELKPKVIDWMGRNDYSTKEIAAFKRTKDWRCNTTVGAVAACLLKGMADVRKDFNNGKSSVSWLKSEISRIMTEGKNDIDLTLVPTPVKQSVVAPNIQDRIRDQAVAMSAEIDQAIDKFIIDPDEFDPKAFKMVNLLRGKGAKAAQARYIKSFFERGHNELKELASGEADPQLREAYQHHPRKNIRKLIEFYENISSACEQIIAEAKILKKPRAKKIKPAEELVRRVKFKLSDDKLGITSVPPAQLITAQGAVLFNTKTRKISYVISKSSQGLGVKGSALVDFSEKSLQKTLRNPAQQLKECKEQNTQKRFETWFSKSIKTTETQISGRLNEDTIILRIFK